MCCLGDFEGCDLVFPRCRTAVRYREVDVLLASQTGTGAHRFLLTPSPRLSARPGWVNPASNMLQSGVHRGKS
jgi:hypothetical protein